MLQNDKVFNITFWHQENTAHINKKEKGKTCATTYVDCCQVLYLQNF